MANSNGISYNGISIFQSNSDSVQHALGRVTPFFIQVRIRVASASVVAGTAVLTSSCDLDEKYCPHFATIGEATRYIDNIGAANFIPALTSSIVGGFSGSLTLT